MSDSLPSNVATARPLGKLYLSRTEYQKFILENSNGRTSAPTVTLSNAEAEVRNKTLCRNISAYGFMVCYVFKKSMLTPAIK
jgi:hypothetical protein